VLPRSVLLARQAVCARFGHYVRGAGNSPNAWSTISRRGATVGSSATGGDHGHSTGFGVGAVADARYLGLQVDRAGQRRQRGNQADGESFEPVLSADGRFVAFTSDASNLVPDDTNGESNVFVRDNRIGQTERVGVGPAGEQLSRTTLAGISDDGRYVAFHGSSTGCPFPALLIRDRHRDTTECVDTAGLGVGTPGALSATGRFVVAYVGDRVV
jgi:hypothetical protein